MIEKTPGSQMCSPALVTPNRSTTSESNCRQCTLRSTVFLSSDAIRAAGALHAVVQLPAGPAVIALGRGPLYLYWPTCAGSGSVVIHVSCCQLFPPTVCVAECSAKKYVVTQRLASCVLLPSVVMSELSRKKTRFLFLLSATGRSCFPAACAPRGLCYQV